MVKLIVKLCKVILDIQNFLELWRIQSLTTAEKKTVFKTLALLKVVYHALLIVIPNLDGLINRWADKGSN